MWSLRVRHTRKLQEFGNKEHGNVSGCGPKYMGHLEYYIMRNYAIYTEEQVLYSQA
jgi:hypothetical protein